MNKIQKIEVLLEPECSLDQLKEAGFEKGCGCKEIDSVVNKLEIELACKNLTHKERQVIELIEFGYCQKEICEDLKVSPHTVRAILNKLSGIIN
jgi:DNA-binding NarL/FixJ family response regulator